MALPSLVELRVRQHQQRQAVLELMEESGVKFVDWHHAAFWAWSQWLVDETEADSLLIDWHN